MEIGGDTTGLDKALKGVNSNIRDTQAQLKDVERLLKLDPKNTELLAQKQKLLAQSVSDVSEKLKTLKEAERQAQEQLKKGDMSQSQYDALKREIIATEQTLKKYTAQAEDAANASEDLGDAVEDAGDAAEEANDGFTVAKGALADLAARGFEKAIDAAKDFAVNMLDSAAEVKAQASQFEQTFGDMADEAQASISRIAKSTGILETRLNSGATSIYAFAKASGANSNEALSLMDTALQAAADSAAYYDTSLEDATETLQSFLKGNFANDAALGVSATETTRNAKAMELFGEKYNDLSEIQKQQTLLAMVTDAQKLSGAMGQASREADGWENVQGNLNEAWRQFQAKVGTPVLEKLIPVIQDITENIDWLSDNLPAIGTLIGGITTAIVAQTVATKAKALADAAAASETTVLTMAQQGLNAAMKANPIGIVITAITLLVTAFELLWDNCEGFRNFFINMWEGIKKVVKAVIDWFITAWKNVSSFFTRLWEGIASVFKSIWEGMKQAFKLPINWIINGINKFIRGINKIKIPDWVPGVGGKGFHINEIPLLAKGGVLERGQVGLLEGNGAEAVVPLDQNRKWIAAVAQDMMSACGAMQNGAPMGTQINIYPQSLDNSTIDYLFARFDAKMGAMA